jgi:hypothetical protein
MKAINRVAPDENVGSDISLGPAFYELTFGSSPLRKSVSSVFSPE